MSSEPPVSKPARKRRWEDAAPIPVVAAPPQLEQYASSFAPPPPPPPPPTLALAKAQQVLQQSLKVPVGNQIATINTATATQLILGTSTGSNNQENRIYVGSLSLEMTATEILSLFSPFGTVIKVEMSFEPVSGKSKGYCFVEFATNDSARAALSMHEFDLGLRKIRVSRPSNYNAATAAIDAKVAAVSASALDVQKLLSEALGHTDQPSAAANASSSSSGSTTSAAVPVLTQTRPDPLTSSKWLLIKNIHPEYSLTELETIFSAFGVLEMCSMIPTHVAVFTTTPPSPPTILGLPLMMHIGYADEETARHVSIAVQGLLLAGLGITAELVPDPLARAKVAAL